MIPVAFGEVASSQWMCEHVRKVKNDYWKDCLDGGVHHIEYYTDDSCSDKDIEEEEDYMHLLHQELNQEGQLLRDIISSRYITSLLQLISGPM